MAADHMRRFDQALESALRSDEQVSPDGHTAHGPDQIVTQGDVPREITGADLTTALRDAFFRLLNKRSERGA